VAGRGIAQHQRQGVELVFEAGEQGGVQHACLPVLSDRGPG
jgi:hypothetical protein